MSPIRQFYSSVEQRVNKLNGILADPSGDYQETLKDVHMVLLDLNLVRMISKYDEVNKSLKSAEQEASTFLSKKSSLPSLTKPNNDTFLSYSEDDLQDSHGSRMTKSEREIREELEDLQLEVEILDSKVKQLDKQIKNETIGSSSHRIQSPQEMTTEEILQKYCVAPPRAKRNKIWSLQKKADKGDSNSQYLLGACYATGKNVPQSKEKALEYYLLSAENGDANGQYSAANCYYYGKGAAVNKKKALKLFTLAAEQDHDKAQFALGHIYEFGKCGLDPDYEKAIQWYRKAAQNGHEAAIQRLRNESDEEIK